ncbi:MAG TPA: hypothetical protein VF075_12250, partial [Pyrinomonadaceae bacterium]
MDQKNPELLVQLVQDRIQRIETTPQLSNRLLFNKEEFEEYILIITGDTKTPMQVRQEYARDLLSSSIVEVLCVAYDKGVNPEQDMTNSPLVPYLYSQSEWIADLFTFARTVRGKQLEFGIGESAKHSQDKTLRNLLAHWTRSPRQKNHYCERNT